MRAAAVPLATRALIVVAGVGLAVVPSPLHIVTVVLTVAAGTATAMAPQRLGALVPTAAFGIAWLAAGGWDASPDPGRTVVAALLLYVVHQATALAGVLPLDAVVGPGVLRRWLLRCVPAVALAAVVATVDLAVSRRSGSPLLEVAALVAVVVVLGLCLRPVLLAPGPGERRV